VKSVSRNANEDGITMSVLSKFFFSKTAIIAALLCCSVLLLGCKLVCIAEAQDLNTSKMTLQDQQPSATASPTQLTSLPSTPSEPSSQTPFNPLVPFVLQGQNQTAAEVTSSDPPVTVEPTAGNETANASPPAAATSQDAAQQTQLFITNETRPEANNASLAAIQVSQGGSLNGLVTLTVLSYAAAGVVLAVMRYWSFSFSDDDESAADVRSTGQADVNGAGYSILETVDYRRI
jgi:hypothetical protein